MAKKSALTAYAYDLPEALIASTPLEERDSSRLFVYDTLADTVTLDSFCSLPDMLPANSLLVFNDTKVIPARLDLRKETGGRVECLLLMNELREADEAVRALADRKLVIGQKVFCGPAHSFTVSGQDENVFLLTPDFPMRDLPELLDRFGHTPVPKYLGRPGLSESQLRERYQTVWAKNPASIAAPTASLHFTQRLRKELEDKGIDSATLSLHVGLGTFAPVTEENLRDKRLHRERYFIPAETSRKIMEARGSGRRVVAVGTTATRALESAADMLLSSGGEGDVLGETSLFIMPPFRFRLTDAMITNFHLPQSSLMCLVDAFLKQKAARRTLLDLYSIAVCEKFRFYSFGDAMLIK